MSNPRFIIGVVIAIIALKWFASPSGDALEGPGIVSITPENFEAELLAPGEPVLAYFWAPW